MQSEKQLKKFQFFKEYPAKKLGKNSVMSLKEIVLTGLFLIMLASSFFVIADEFQKKQDIVFESLVIKSNNIESKLKENNILYEKQQDAFKQRILFSINTDMKKAEELTQKLSNSLVDEPVSTITSHRNLKTGSVNIWFTVNRIEK